MPMSMSLPRHLPMKELEAGLEMIEQSPTTAGVLAMIVVRPGVESREVKEAAELHPEKGLVGDRWSEDVAKGATHPDAQLTIMNTRVLQLLAGDEECWPLAGDQLLIDLNLGEDNLPPGTRLAVGSAVIEITAQPHRGCNKFSERFGRDATKFVNSPLGVKLNLRGVHAKVVQPGTIRVGDVASKI